MSAPHYVNGPPGAGRTFLLGGTILVASFAGFYANMQRNKRKQEALGTNPIHEQILAHVSRRPTADEALPTMNWKHNFSDNPPAHRTDSHHSGHTTRDSYKKSAEYAESGPSMLYMVPPPQRAHSDGSGRPYTKSPDYAKNYEKTKRSIAAKVVEEV